MDLKKNLPLGPMKFPGLAGAALVLVLHDALPAVQLQVEVLPTRSQP